MMQVLDTNVLVRHFSGAPADQARAATAFLKAAEPRQLLLTDVHLAELVWVLESSIYQADRATIVGVLDAVLALQAIEVGDRAMLQNAIDLYGQRRMDWTDAYLVASAISMKARVVVSFDRFDSKLVDVGVRRIEPSSALKTP